MSKIDLLRELCRFSMNDEKKNKNGLTFKAWTEKAGVSYHSMEPNYHKRHLAWSEGREPNTYRNSYVLCSVNHPDRFFKAEDNAEAEDYVNENFDDGPMTLYCLRVQDHLSLKVVTSWG